MIIKRTINGTEVEIELTSAEIERAYRQAEREYRIQDVRSHWCDMHDEADDECPLSYFDCYSIAERAESIMSKMDNYWDCYWACFEVAIREFEEEM